MPNAPPGPAGMTNWMVLPLKKFSCAVTGPAVKPVVMKNTVTAEPNVEFICLSFVFSRVEIF